MISLDSIVGKTCAASKCAIFGFVLIACSMGFASQVSAISLDESSVQYLGNIFDGNPPGNNEDDYINTLLDQPSPSGPTLVGTEFYTRSSNDCGGPCPAATETGSVKDDTNPSNTVDVTGFEYLLGKYDADQAGSYVWWVGDLTGNQTIPTNLGTCGESGCGLSHWSLFNGTPGPGPGTPGPGEEVPEPSTLILLGSGLLFALAAKRRFDRRS